MLQLKHRLRLYVKFTTIFLAVAIGLPPLIPFIIGSKVISGLGIMAVFILSHAYLGYNLIEEASKSGRLLFSTIITIVSAALMIFKIWVNESIHNDHFNPVGRLFEFGRKFNYIFFFIWSSIIIWEIVTFVRSYRKRIKRGNASTNIM